MRDRVAGIVGSWEERWRKAIKLQEIGRAREMENVDFNFLWIFIPLSRPLYLRFGFAIFFWAFILFFWKICEGGGGGWRIRFMILIRVQEKAPQIMLPL